MSIHFHPCTMQMSNAASNLRHPSLRCQVPLPWSSAKAKLCASANCLCFSQGDLNWFWTYTSSTKCWEPTSCKPSHLPLLHEYPLNVKNKTLAQHQLRMNTPQRMTSKTQTVPKVASDLLTLVKTMLSPQPSRMKYCGRTSFFCPHRNLEAFCAAKTGFTATRALKSFEPFICTLQKPNFTW